MLNRWLGTVCVVWLALGCGDEPAGRPAYETGIAGVDQNVRGLDDSQLMQVCQSFDVYVDTYVDLSAVAHVACLPQALLLGGDRAGCEQRLRTCMDLFPEPIRVQGRARSEKACFDDLRSCEATVAELEGCANVNLDQILQFGDWSCDLVGDEEVMTMVRGYSSTVSVCADLDDACNRFARVGAPD